MLPYFLAMMLLSGGSFIRSKSEVPEMRPASRASDLAWGWLAKAAFWGWIGLIIWGFFTYHWSQPVAAVLASLAVNALIATRGPMRTWPGISMLFCLSGLLAGLAAVMNPVLS